MKTLAPEAVKIINNYAALAQYKRTPIFEKYITCPLKTTALFTGNQCLAGETEIYDPVLGKNRQVKDIDGDFHVLAWDGETLVPAAAMKPFMKPPEQLYRVSVEDGSSFISTGDHRILTRRGWDSVASLRQGSALFRPPSISGNAPSVPSEDGRRSFETIPDSRDGCPCDPHSHDEQLRLASGIGQASPPSPIYARRRMARFALHGDVRRSRHASSPLSEYAHLSNQDGLLRYEAPGAGTSPRVAYRGLRHVYGKPRGPVQLEGGLLLLPQPSFEEDPHQSVSAGDQFGALSTSGGLLVTNITVNRYDVTYDFHVPIFNNYLASGIIHKNCGKTAMVIVSWVLRFLSMHPVASKNFNWLICNKKKNHRFSLLYRKPGMLCNYQGCEGKLEVHVSPFRKMRFASENLPFQSATTGPAHKGGTAIEVRNTQYPELIKWLPPYLIKKNISSHNTVMVIKDVWGLSDIIPEFVSYNQDVQAMAGVQLAGCAFDEEPPPAFFEEMQVRMLATDGTVDIGLTPANRLCFDAETEIVTEKGWCKYDEINMSDKILTYNLKRNCYEWKNMIGFHMSKVDENLIEMKSPNFDALVTSGHKWVASNGRHRTDYKLIKVEDLNSKYYIKRVSTLAGGDGANTNKYDDEFIALVGWAVTDGTFSSGYTKIVIYQSLSAYPKHCESIRKLISKYPECTHETQYDYKPRIMPGGNVWNGTGRVCHFAISRQLARDMRLVTNGKTINQDFICSLSERQLWVLFDAMIDGDGHREKINVGAFSFTQVGNDKLIYDMQLISSLLGKRTTIRRYKDKRDPNSKVVTCIYMHKDSLRYSSDTTVATLKIKEFPYCGIVWCPSTENGTVVSRRNEHVSISGNTYMYDQIYTQAQVYYRSETICKELGLSPEERTDSRKSIAVFQAATDDNPTLDKKTIERVMTDLDTDGDPDKLMIRRYGVFKAVSTTIFRAFSYAVHYLPMEKWFPGGVPENWLHARSIDYHPVVPWAMIHISLSDTNEAFVWWEANPDPMRLVTDEIAMKLAQGAGDYRFKIDRIDPLANQKQSKRTRDEARTTSVTEDLNDQLRKLKARGIGAGGAFIGFETKSTRGREQIKLRLKNSVECKEPFDNKRQDEHGNQYFLPTLWIMDTCPAVAKSMKNWRLDDHADSGALITKDAKETPQQKWSHFPMTIEGILKEEGFRPPIVWERPDDRNRSSYFSEGRGERGALHARMR